jgi:hypothetical protein
MEEGAQFFLAAVQARIAEEGVQQPDEDLCQFVPRRFVEGEFFLRQSDHLLLYEAESERRGHGEVVAGLQERTHVRILRDFGDGQALRWYDRCVPALRALDPLFRWTGISLLACAERR